MVWNVLVQVRNGSDRKSHWRKTFFFVDRQWIAFGPSSWGIFFGPMVDPERYVVFGFSNEKRILSHFSFQDVLSAIQSENFCKIELSAFHGLQ
jgi:hypothetical protein